MPYELNQETQAAAKRFHEMREQLGYAQVERDWKLHVWGIGKIKPIKGQTVFDLQEKERREQEAKGA